MNKKIVKFTKTLSLLDVQLAVNNGWNVSKFKGRLCLENSKTIFAPLSMPKL